MKREIKNFLLDLLFPRFCFGCKKEGTYLCPDCKSTMEVFGGKHFKAPIKDLDDLFFPLEYQNPLLKKLIHHYKYEPFIKELSFPLSSLVLDHFYLLNTPPSFLKNKRGVVLVPVPLHPSKLRWRGFNQAEEIARNLSVSLNIPIIKDVLIKTKSTPTKNKLRGKGRETNILNAFQCLRSEKIKNKRVLLVDDVYTTGSTLQETARVLKSHQAKKVIGIVVARSRPE